MKRGLTANATRLLILFLGVSNHPILANESWERVDMYHCETNILFPNSDISQPIDPCQSDIGLIYFEAGFQTDCESSPTLSMEVIPAGQAAIYPVFQHAHLTTYAFMASAGNYKVFLSAEGASETVLQDSFQISLTSQSYPEVHLACNDTLQLPVGEDCQVVISPDMLLEGEFGCLTDDDFVIEVADDSPENGSLLDGAGTFAYTISRKGYLPIAGFEDIFYKEKWKTSAEGNASILWEDQQLNMEAASGEGTSHAVALIQIPTSGRLSCTWTYTSEDSGPFAMAYLAHENGLVEVLHTSSISENSLFNRELPEGSLLAIELRSEAGTSSNSQLLLADWLFEPTPLEGHFFSCSGFLIATDKQTPLLNCPTISYQSVNCTDRHRLLLSHLPEGTPNCYHLDANGEILFPEEESAVEKLKILLDWLEPFGFPHHGDEDGYGSLTDNCSPVEICISDQMESGENCGDTYITRRFTATDPSGNTSSCEQSLLIQSPGIAQVVKTTEVAYIACDMEYPMDDEGFPHPDFTGWPMIETAFGNYPLNPEQCNLNAFYEDYPLVEVCDNAHQFIRKWSVVDWCKPLETLEFFQTIKIGDVRPPTIYCPTNGANGDTLVYQVGPFDCFGSLWVPNATIEDNCSESWEVTTQVVSYPYPGEPAVVLANVPNNGDPRYVSQIPLGVHYFRYTVKDDCGNRTVSECPFKMVDKTAPIASCVDELHVSLGGDGLAKVLAERIDEGSWDECGIVKMEVRRWFHTDDACNTIDPIYGEWGEFVAFGCCDADSLVKVELLVTDLAGNQGSCWMNVLLEDKELPICTAPHDKSILCDELPFYPNDSIPVEVLQQLFGIPDLSDNCDAFWTELEPLIELDQCGEGQITRTFKVEDDHGNVAGGNCRQLIQVGLSHYYDIKFPKDARAECGLPAPDTIMTREVGCDLLAVSVMDERFNVSPDACFLVHRTYRVINWCEYDGESDPIVLGRDEDCDGEVGEEAVWVLHRRDTTFIDRDNNENNAVPEAGTKEDACDGTTNPEGYWRTLESNGYWEYTQIMEIFDHTPPSVFFAPPPPFCSFNNVTCKAPVEYFFLVFEACSPLDISFEIFYDENFDGELDEDVPTEGIDGEYPKFRILREYPIGSHAFVVFATDGCGNTSRTDLPFDVVDCYIDPPICINGLAVELGPVEPGTDADGDGTEDTGAVVVWATDFLASRTTDCLGPLEYSINRVGEETIREQTSLVLTCDDRPSVAVEIFSWDQAGNPYKLQLDGSMGGPNFDKCETYVLVQDNLELACFETTMLSGTIRTEVGMPVVEVPIMLSGNELSGQATTTGAGGVYQLDNLLTGYDYTIMPYWNEDPLNGVTTFDLILITKHILGVANLDSPFKMLAADVNNSRNITTLDLISLRRLILGIDESFLNNTSWRFVDDSYVFPNENNPWATSFPEGISINNLSLNEVNNIDFTGLKVGDVNNSASMNYGIGRSIEERSQRQVELSVENKTVREGKTFRVPVYLSNLEAVQGFQFSLQFDEEALVMKEVNGGLLDDAHWGTRFLKEGMLTLSWNAPGADVLTFTGEKVLLFELVFEANAKGQLEEFLDLGGFTPAEAYGEDADILKVNLQFGEKNESPHTTFLFQNVPNPFSDVTHISFYIQEESAVQLAVFSATGQLLYQKSKRYEIGHYQLRLDGAEWPSGVLYCQLVTSKGRWNQKMIHIKEN